MVEESINQEFSLKYIDETKNYFLKQIEQIELIIKKQEKVCTTLNYIKHFLVLVHLITGCIFRSLL